MSEHHPACAIDLLRVTAARLAEHPLVRAGMKDWAHLGGIEAEIETQEKKVRARHILREPPRPGETDAAYIARAERELSSVTPPPVVECRNETPLRARFCVLPPGAVSWTERGWDVLTREATPLDATEGATS